MNHMVGLLAVVLTLTAWGEVAQAQHPAKSPCLVFPFFGSRDQPHLESFHQGLRDLGYVDGKNISIEYRYAERSSDRLAILAAELVALNLDVIFTTGPAATRAVLQASSRTPIGAIGFDPVATGLGQESAIPRRKRYRTIKQRWP
jgi:putative tryptophan/tyrosine transport system substrate-binding protein